MKVSDLPIQRKLMRVSLLTSGAVLFLTFASYFVYELVTFQQTTEATLSTIGKIVATNSTAALAFDDARDGNEILNALQADKYIEAAALYKMDGTLFSKYPATLANGAFPGVPRADGYTFSTTHLEGFQPVVQGNTRLGTLYIRQNLNAMYGRLLLYGFIAFVVTGLSFLMAYLLSHEFQKVISGPILSLANTAQTVSQQSDYSVRATKAGNDEIGLLTDAFNDMLRQIEAQNMEIRSFTTSLETMVHERTSELEQANLELKKKNEFVETIIDSSVHIIAVLDTDMRYTTVNRKCEEVYQVTRQEILGKRFTEAFPQTDGTIMHQHIRQALEGIPMHNPITRSAVVQGYFETYCVPLMEEDKVYGVLLMSHDITNIVEANENLKIANEELVKSNIELEQFAYVASHDLQEPLRKIQVFTDLIRNKRPDEEETNKYLERVHASAQRMTALIKDLLNYSRLSRKEEVIVDTDLNDIVNLVLSDFEMMIQQRGATLVVDELPVIRGIKHQLGQLFANLISNALKFSQQNPVVKITASELPKSSYKQYGPLDQNQDYWNISVSDNGIGFDPLYSRQIFTIFQRLNDQKKYSGTGIGLAICRKIVENHRGLIFASSSPGQGATFSIILPMSPEAKPSAQLQIL